MILIVFLIIGLALGPSGVELKMPTSLAVISQIAGGIFLLFAGWEIRFLGLGSDKRFYALGFLGTFGVPVLAALFFFPENLFIPLAFGISALPVAIQILKEKNRYDSPLARKTLTLASLCDLAAWLLMFFIFPAESAGAWLRSHWFIFMFFMGIALSQWRSMPSAAFRFQKWLLAPIFFICLGWRIPLFELFNLTVFVKIFAVAVTAKLTGVYIFARLAKSTHHEALELAFLLNARGAMEIVAAHTAFSAGLIDGGVFTGLVVLGLVTSVMAVPFVRHNSNLSKAA